ncbi:unnamed protein product [Urochloa humidicola]
MAMMPLPALESSVAPCSHSPEAAARARKLGACTHQRPQARRLAPSAQFSSPVATHLLAHVLPPPARLQKPRSCPAADGT